MAYRLLFIKKSEKEWKKLSQPIREQFKKKLKERLENPHVRADKLSGFQNVYKIKLRSSGFRLAYEVIDEKIVVIVLSVGKREDGAVYRELVEPQMGMSFRIAVCDLQTKKVRVLSSRYKSAQSVEGVFANLSFDL